MKKIKVLFISFISILILVGCGQTRNMTVTNSNPDVITMGAAVVSTEEGTMRAFVYYYTPKQVDSMCIIDRLPRNLDEWISERYLDFEYSRYVTKRMYIKVYSEESELIYILIPRENLYKVTKRFVNCDPYEETKKTRPVKKNPPKLKYLDDKFNRK